MRAELVVRGGTVIDGTGVDPVRADVTVADGRIVEIGPDLPVGVADVLDAEGCLVAPGFIDLHTHYDAQIWWDPWLSPSSQLGVTSIVAGSCGFSLAPCRPTHRELMMRTLESVEDMSLDALAEGVVWDFETYPEYLRAVRRRGLGTNFGGFVGHTAVRLFVMGDAGYERAATPEEIHQMARVVREAVRAGALGFSTDLGGVVKGADGRPVPSVVATDDEVATLARAVSDEGRGLVQVSPGDHRFEWVVGELAPTLRRPLTWTPMIETAQVIDGVPLWQRKLDCHLEGLARGVDARPQVTSRALTFHFTMANPIAFVRYPTFGALPRSLPVAERSRILADRSFRDRVQNELDAAASWRNITVGDSRRTELIDRTIADLAAEGDADGLDVILDLALSENLETRFCIAGANTDEGIVTRLLTTPGAVIGLSDAGAHVGQLCDAVLPLDFLGWWVRDREIMSPQAGIRKLTGELADLLDLADRGYVKPGMWADLTVLDWDRVEPGPIERVPDLPGGADRLVANQPQGVRHVLVNGTVVREDESPQQSRTLPGELLTPR